MSEIITDVHTITAATGWFVVKDGLRLQSVACFALVSSFDTDHKYFNARQMIALTENELGLDLVGTAIDTERQIQHYQDPLAADLPQFV